MRSRWLGLAAALVAALASAVLWRHLPPEVVTHWNLRGEPDGWSSRTFAALFGPLVILAVTLLFQVVPRIDPRRANYAKFIDVYWFVANGVILFITVLHLILLSAGIGAPVGAPRLLAGLLAVLMIVLGNLLGRIRPNWFIGVRTPWTLESAEVWRKTHRAAAWLFVLAGVATGLAVLIPSANPLRVSVVAVIVAAVASAGLSLVLWLKENRT